MRSIHVIHRIQVKIPRLPSTDPSALLGTGVGQTTLLGPMHCNVVVWYALSYFLFIDFNCFMVLNLFLNQIKACHHHYI